MDLIAAEEGADDLAVSHYKFVADRLTNLDCQELDRVGAALDRLEAGTYVTCQDCGCLISNQRLQAIPWAVRCHKCEERIEARPAAMAGAA